MAKRKKPAGNPARGFATTSIASKPKPERAAADVPPKEVAGQAQPKESVTVPEPSVETSQQAEALREEVAPTPEELEAQLERDELQLLVEKHAAKVRRETNRHVSKFQTDRRVLRGQSHPMTVHDWLPVEILDSIVSLDLTLRDLGFSHDHIQPVLKWLCANAASVDASSSIWGLQEALEWLALDQCEGHSFSYEETRPKRSTIDTPDASRPREYTCEPGLQYLLCLTSFMQQVTS
jgi:ATP-dependent RNA helicase DHX29